MNYKEKAGKKGGQVQKKRREGNIEAVWQRAKPKKKKGTADSHGAKKEQKNADPKTNSTKGSPIRECSAGPETRIGGRCKPKKAAQAA